MFHDHNIHPELVTRPDLDLRFYDGISDIVQPNVNWNKAVNTTEISG